MTPTQRNGLIGGAVVVLLIAIIGIGWAVQSNRDTTGDDAARPSNGNSATAQESSSPSGEASAGADESPAPAPQVAVQADGEFGIGMGDPEAPVKVEVFEDYQCPHCADFEEASHAELLKAAQDGSAYVVYRPMAFLNEYSARAMNAFGVVLDAAGPEAALEFHQILFENQPSGTMPSTDDFVAWAVQAGATGADVRKGIEQMTFAQWVVNANDDASKRKVTSTPTVFVNGDPVGGNSIEELTANTMNAITAG